MVRCPHRILNVDWKNMDGHGENSVTPTPKMSNPDDTFRILSRPPFDEPLRLYREMMYTGSDEWEEWQDKIAKLGWPQEEFEIEYLRRYGRW